MRSVPEVIERQRQILELAADQRHRRLQVVALGAGDPHRIALNGALHLELAGAQVARRLAEAGSDKSRILRAHIYLSDIADIAAMNAVWDAWVVPGTAPPRATVQAALADPGWKIEIVVTAAVG